MFAHATHRSTLVLAILLTSVAALTAQQRTWTDNTGRFSVEAEFEEVKEDSVVLKKASGSLITVPVARLSETDREYLQSLDQLASQPSTRESTREYPSFPDAVTEPPRWIDANTPFDVAQFFKVPPPAQNAAPLYLEAFSEFDYDVSTVCFWPLREGPPREEARRRMEMFRQRADEYIRFEEAWENDPKSVDNAAVDAWLTEYEPGFEKLAIAQKRPECVFETGVCSVSLLPHVQAAREVARVVTWRTRRDLQQGEYDRPIRDIETTLRVSRDLQRRGGWVCQLVSVAIDQLCCQEVVVPFLHADGIEKKHCIRLLAVLDRHEADSHRRFAEGIRAEYVMARKILYDFQHHTGGCSPQFLKDMDVRGPANSPLTYLQLLGALGDAGCGRMAAEKYGKGAAGLPPDHPLVAGWTVNGKLMSNDDFAKEVDALNRVYATILDSADRTTRERLDICRDAEIYEPLRDTKVALFVEPYCEPVFETLLRADAILRGTKCLIALRLWQLDHSDPATDLDAIVQAAGMSEVPTDPYADQPMRMTTVDERPVIYSIGPDGKDDQALVEWDLNTGNPTGDLLFHGPIPQ